MSPGFPDDPLRAARAEENDPLWALLGRAPMRQPDGWFAARTLARCRLAATAPGWSWQRPWRWALGTGLCLCLALLAVTRLQNESAVSDHQKNVQEAFEIVASMGDDTADSVPAPTPASWQDSSY